MRNQINYMMMKKIFRNALLSVKARPGPGIESDHVPVLSQLKSKTHEAKESRTTNKA